MTLYIRGNPYTATIAIIGEAPGATEIKKSMAFAGSSGVLLQNCLQLAGINLSDVYMDNVFHFRPSNNYIKPYLDLSKDKNVYSEEFIKAKELLKDRLDQCSANVIVACGKTALYTLTNEKEIFKYRGSILESTLLPGRKVIPTIHPAACLYTDQTHQVETTKNVIPYNLRYYIISDLMKAKRHSLFPEIPLPDYTIITYPSVQDIVKLLKEFAVSDEPTAVDIETPKGYIKCIGLGNSKKALVIPFYTNNDNYFNPIEEIEVFRQLDNFLSNPLIHKIFHNGNFDIAYILNEWNIVVKGKIHDTQIATGILSPEFPKSLHAVTSVHTDMPYYKDERKGQGLSREDKKVGDKAFFEYNGKDVIATAKSLKDMLPLIKQEGNYKTYDDYSDLIFPTVYMQEYGFRVNVDKLNNDGDLFDIELQATEEGVYKAIEDTGKYTNSCRDINLNSPKQLCNFFYKTLGYTPIKNREGNETVDEKALKKLSGRGCKVASKLLIYRRQKKLSSTYYKIPFTSNNRFKYSVNIVGTKFGRLSTSKSLIHKIGANIQNIPHNFRKYLVPDEGNLLIQMDLSQAENRCVAYLANDYNMIKAFESGADIHKLTASIIFGKPIDEITTEDGTCSLGNGDQSERYWGKKANHQLNYKSSYLGFARQYEIPYNESKFIVSQYYAGYPSIGNWHDFVIREVCSKGYLVNLYGRRYLFIGERKGDTFREAISYVPQSTIGHKINKDGLLFLWYNENPIIRAFKLHCQVHDSLVLSFPVEKLGFKSCVEGIILIKQSLEKPLYYMEREFIIPCACEVGLNWAPYHKEHNKKGLIGVNINGTSIRELVTILQGIYKEHRTS